jgi:cyclopropane fatty-acyl-phospholipid synthase-like methyltransferase
MPDNDKGFFIGAEDGLFYDHKLGEGLAYFLKTENCLSVVDFGCGTGHYVKNLRDHGIKCDGFDGNPSTPELTGWIESEPACGILDLTEPIVFEKKYDWVLSLEVGEHIPKEHEATFINNLHTNNKEGIVLSWAIEGQGGNGHNNEQNNDYIKSIFKSLGYTNDSKAEERLRQNTSLWWFRNTIMVFGKGE